MLYPVRGYPALCAAHANKRALGDIIVQAVHIWIGMMDDVVLEFPDKTVTPQCIQCKTKQLVDFLIRRIAAMISIMHHIESNAS